MKKIFIIISVLFAVADATAQGFDWAESFGNVFQHNEIKFIDTDSAGFIYIAGDFSTDAELGGTRLLNMTPYGPHPNNNCSFVAKLDPADGHVIWRKAIHHNDGGVAVCNSMQVVGDSAIVWSVNHRLATRLSYLYYLDTLITRGSYPFRFCEGALYGTGFIWLNTDGDLIENHYLQVGYFDTAGCAINVGGINNRPGDTSNMFFLALSGLPSYVDKDGYIYIMRVAGDKKGVYLYDSIEHRDTFMFYSVWDGQLKTIRFLIDVDGGVFDYVPDGDGEQLGFYNTMLLKFSPHFDSLLWVKYIIKDTVSVNGPARFEMEMYISAITGDEEGNIYITGLIGNFFPYDSNWQKTFLLDTVLNEKSITMTPYQQQIGFTVKYNPDGNVVWVNAIQGYTDNDAIVRQATSAANNLYVTDSSVYVNAEAGRFYSSFHYTFLNDDVLENRLCRTFFLKYDRDDGSLQQCGVARSHGETLSSGLPSSPPIVAKDGRIFVHVLFQNNIQSIDSSYDLDDPRQTDQALVQWDELGHCVKVMPYNGAAGGPHAICMHNDVIYGCGTLDNPGGITFGSHHVDGGAYIYKYTDTSLLTPYHARRDQRIDWEQHLALSLEDGYVLLGAVASSGLPVTYGIDDTAIASLRGDTLFLAQAGTTTLRANQPGNEDWYPAEEVAKTLVVSTRASQSILWNQSLNADSGTAFIVLNATATSGLPVSYSIDDTSLATLHADTLLIHGHGGTLVRASQSGNEYYLPAAEVAKRLTVTDVGVGEVEGRAPINVYPNPATGRLTVCTAAPVQSIRLVNMLGQTVLAHGPTGGTATLAVGHLERGAYFLRIIGNDDVTTRKVILK